MCISDGKSWNWFEQVKAGKGKTKSRIFETDWWRKKSAWKKGIYSQKKPPSLEFHVFKNIFQELKYL